MIELSGAIGFFADYLRTLSLSLRNRYNDNKMFIGGVVVDNLKPLGQVTTPGLTKAGRLSFYGLIESNRVKIYETYSHKQLLLRKRLAKTEFGKKHLPKIIVAENNLVVEEWIIGKKVVQTKTSVCKAIKNIISTIHDSREMKAIVEQNQGAFCYLTDYIYPRVTKWEAMESVKIFAQEWKKNYNKVAVSLPIRLSHPDLSAANIIQEKSSGRFVLIDNELLGVGHGWILDWHNSLLPRSEILNSSLIHDRLPEYFLEKTWGLRLLGTALDKGDFTLANRIACGNS